MVEAINAGVGRNWVAVCGLWPVHADLALIFRDMAIAAVQNFVWLFPFGGGLVLVVGKSKTAFIVFALSAVIFTSICVMKVAELTSFTDTQPTQTQPEPSVVPITASPAR